MGRYLGPKHRICRRAGEKLCDANRCPSTRRGYPPGIHGQQVGRKITEYGAQLLEKQKARSVYGLMERQLRTYYESAIRQEGDTAHNLSVLLETRLDNVAFRLGFAKTRADARQSVSHGHLIVNGKRMTIPSYHVRTGDRIAIDPRSKNSPRFSIARDAAVILPTWLSYDRDAGVGTVIRAPQADDVQHPFRLQSIVEFYSR